jgi:hypothetical protein
MIVKYGFRFDNFKLLALLSLFLVACGLNSKIPTETQEKQLWLESEAESFRVTVAHGLKNTLGSGVLEQGETVINRDKPMVTFVYQTEKSKWVDYALSEHANYTDLLIILSFQVRKNLCQDVFDSNLHRNDVKIGVMISVKNLHDYLTVFEESNCQLYL